MVYNNDTDIQTDIHSTDSHGINQVNFAILDMFGYRFAPRYTNISSPILEVTFQLQEGFDHKKVDMFKKMRSNQPATPSAGIIMLVIVLESVGFPSEKLAVALAMIMSVDRPLDMARTVVNISGDSCVCVLVAKSLKKLK